MKTAVENANYLKDRADELMPRGPLVEVVFNGEGPIGMHIVNVPMTDAHGKRGPDRVVVASAAEGAQAENRIFFGEQVMQVNGVSTKGMKMKEVKLMIADAERPVRIVLQPLCFKTTRHDDFPLCPPRSPTFKGSDLLWGLISRPYALEEIGSERRVQPTNFVDYVSLVPEYVFIRSVKDEDRDILCEGDRIIEVDGKKGKMVLEGLLRAKYPGTEIVLQKVRVSGIIHCPRCNAREWVFSRFCSMCGSEQKSRRS